MNTQTQKVLGMEAGYRERNLEPTSDPRKMVSAVAVAIRGRGFTEETSNDLKEYFRSCLRIARRQGRQEGRGR